MDSCGVNPAHGSQAERGGYRATVITDLWYQQGP